MGEIPNRNDAEQSPVDREKLGVKIIKSEIPAPPEQETLKSQVAKIEIVENVGERRTEEEIERNRALIEEAMEQPENSPVEAKEVPISRIQVVKNVGERRTEEEIQQLKSEREQALSPQKPIEKSKEVTGEKAEPKGEKSRMDYVSINGLMGEVFARGGVPRGLLPEELQIRIERQQRKVANGVSEQISDSDWNETMQAKLEAKDILEKWLADNKGEQRGSKGELKVAVEAQKNEETKEEGASEKVPENTRKLYAEIRAIKNLKKQDPLAGIPTSIKEGREKDIKRVETEIWQIKDGSAKRLAESGRTERSQKEGARDFRNLTEKEDGTHRSLSNERKAMAEAELKQEGKKIIKGKEAIEAYKKRIIEKSLGKIATEKHEKAGRALWERNPNIKVEDRDKFLIKIRKKLGLQGLEGMSALDELINSGYVVEKAKTSWFSDKIEIQKTGVVRPEVFANQKVLLAKKLQESKNGILLEAGRRADRLIDIGREILLKRRSDCGKKIVAETVAQYDTERQNMLEAEAREEDTRIEKERAAEEEEKKKKESKKPAKKVKPRTRVGSASKKKNTEEDIPRVHPALHKFRRRRG